MGEGYMISRRALICSLIGGVVFAGLTLPGCLAEGKLGPGTYAVFTTTEGKFTCKLFSAEAPKTVANFVGLASGTKEWTDPHTGKQVKKPFYNGLIFHRVIDGFMIQGGCPLGTGTGNPGYKFADEFSDNLKFDRAGLLAMANSGPNTNGSQFFVTLGPTPHLNHLHSIFGEVVNGMDVVEKIGHTKTAASRPVKDVVMKEVKIETVK
jgi:peptidyl-prolyl cis-trans isomerase A (cyclophilin A)